MTELQVRDRLKSLFQDTIAAAVGLRVDFDASFEANRALWINSSPKRRRQEYRYDERMEAVDQAIEALRNAVAKL